MTACAMSADRDQSRSSRLTIIRLIMASPASPSRKDQKDRPVVTFVLVLLLGIVVHLHVSTRSLAPTAHFLVRDQSAIPTIVASGNDSTENTLDVKNTTITHLHAVTVESDENSTEAFHVLGDANQHTTATTNETSTVLLHDNSTLLKLQRRQQHLDTIRKMSPIMCAGLPKTGTTSLHRYFASGRRFGNQYYSSHTFTKLPNGTKPRAGACMQDNLRHGNPMLKDCGHYQVWSDSGYAAKGDCFYPLWHALDEFIQQYPYATIVINTRNATEWTRSIQKWARGSLARRWNICRHNNPALPKTLQPREWIEFYQVYHERIRNACKEHTTLKCIEFSITDERAGEIMESNFGIPASQWMNCDPRGMKCKQAGSQVIVGG